MNNTKTSLKNQLITILAPVILFMIIFLWLSDALLEKASRKNAASHIIFSKLFFQIQNTQNNLQQLKNALYRITLESTGHHEDDTVKVDMEVARDSIVALNIQLIETSSAWMGLEVMNTYVSSLDKALVHLQHEVDRYHTIIKNPTARFPGLLLLNEKLLSNNTKLLQNIEVALDETSLIEDKIQRRKVEKLLNELRHAWTQKVSWFRLFIANRSGIFGSAEQSMNANLQNREIFHEKVTRIIQQLNTVTKLKNTSIAGIVSMENINAANSEYEEYFSVARNIYLSENWRADYTYLKNNVDPALTAVGDVLKLLVEKIQENTTTDISSTIDITENISIGIFIMVAVLCLSFLYLYLLSYSRIIRPVQQISIALKNIATGQPDIHVPDTMHRETHDLVEAFHEMSVQVHSRQTRLETILDNAVEGIITIDETGSIETFNIAAQKLFGYAQDEILGTNVADLTNDRTNTIQDFCLDKYLLQYKDENISPGHEIELQAKRKDGSTFPMSVKFNEFTLSGRRYFTVLVDDISEKKAFIDNLRNLAEHDALTGLYNRFYFTKELTHVVERVKRTSKINYALMYIDLDNFKYINDTLGHLAGDQLLVEVSLIIRNQIRKSDLLSRFSGDEFAVLLHDVNSESAMAVAEKIRYSIKNYVFKSSGATVDVGCSIGIAMISSQIISHQELFSQADFACHAAKKAGRNRVHIYTDTDQKKLTALTNDMSWSRKITDTITNDRFILAFQPIRQINNESSKKYEVLLRMLDTDNSIIMPPGFIPAAERFGMIAEVDRWVISHIFNLIEQHHADDGSQFSINISTQSFTHGGMLEFITDKMRHHSIDPERLVFEVTETSAMNDITHAIEFLQALRKLGCKTALDDFGVGYSSFAYLRELPVDIIKIDGGFVHDIHTNPLNYAIIKSINEVALALGKTTVAEFVNSDEAYQALKEIGVHCVQGFFVGKPYFPDYETKRLRLNKIE